MIANKLDGIGVCMIGVCMKSCKFCNNENNRIVFRGKFWTLAFHKQDYLGRCVLYTNRHVDNFNELYDSELVDMRNMLAGVEKELKDLFGCTMLNWCCNMNNVYAEENPEPHVHIHIRPRYKEEVNVNGIVYHDKEFGSHYDRKAPVQFDEDTIKYIYKQMKGNFEKYYEK